MCCRYSPSPSSSVLSMRVSASASRQRGGKVEDDKPWERVDTVAFMLGDRPWSDRGAAALCPLRQLR